jgi:hypothetical protein
LTDGIAGSLLPCVPVGLLLGHGELATVILGPGKKAYEDVSLDAVLGERLVARAPYVGTPPRDPGQATIDPGQATIEGR